MARPIPTDAAAVLRNLQKDVTLLQRTVGQALAAKRQSADGSLDDQSIDNPTTLSMQLQPEIAVVGQSDEDDESILTDQQLWLVLPSTPIITTKALAVSVEWDGYGAGGEAIPENFGVLEYHRSTTPNFEADPAVTLVATAANAGTTVFTDQPYDVVYYYRFVIVTSDGRRTQQSADAAGVATKVNGAYDIEVGSIKTDLLALGVISSNLIHDPSFEENYLFTTFDPFGSGHGIVTQWREGASSSGAANRAVASGYSRSGNNALLLPAAAAGVCGLISNTFATVIGQEYRLVIHAASVVNPASMVIDVQKGSSQTGIFGFSSETLIGDSTWTSPALVSAVPIDPNEYEVFTYTWTATNTWAAVRVTNYLPSAASTLAVDDISVVPVGVGGAAELTAAGLRLFDDDGFEATALVTNRSNYFTVQDKNVILASIDDTGKGSFRKVSITGEDTDADGVIDTGFEVYGTEFKEWIDSLPKGQIAYGQRNVTTGYVSTETPYQQLDFEAKAGRTYDLKATGYVGSDTTSGRGVIRLRVTTDGSVPSVSSTQLTSWRSAHMYGAGGALPFNILRTFATVADADVRLLITFAPEGSGQARIVATANDPQEMEILDTGLYRQDTGIDRTAGSPPSTIKEYTKTWDSTGWAMYQSSGARKTNADDVKQGYSSYDGDAKGLWIFPSLTSTLSGSTISKIRVYLYANHWYYNSGGTALIKVHGYTSIPGSSPSMSTATSSAKWPKPGGRWVTLPSSLHAGFISGTWRGIGVGPAGTQNLLYYGRFNPAAKIEITYRK